MMKAATRTARIEDVHAGDGLSVIVIWKNEPGERVIDLADVVNTIKGLRPIRERAAFRKVHVGEGGHSIAWPGELDIGADRLWELDQEQNGKPGVAFFAKWRADNRFTLNQAADALGIARRTVAYYAAGRLEVPRTVQLACIGLDHMKPKFKFTHIGGKLPPGTRLDSHTGAFVPTSKSRLSQRSIVRESSTGKILSQSERKPTKKTSDRRR